MSIQEGILKEIKRETANTKRVLERITDEHLDWKPHSKSMSLKELAVHIVELHNWFSIAVPKDRFDFKRHYQPLIVSSIAELQDVLEVGLEENIKTVTSFEDDVWFQRWVLCAGDYVIAEMPKLAAARYIIQNHLIHHRGQLTVYLRLLDIPVPGLYGPSADES